MTQADLFEISSKDPDSWLTPRWILDQLGTFDLDPAACEHAPTWVQARARFTPAENGLEHRWTGRVWLNPPFSNIAPWIERAARHQNAIALLPAGHETQAWHRYVWNSADAVFLLSHRVRFVLPNGLQSSGRPRLPIALIAYGLENRRYLETFEGCGAFIDRWQTRGTYRPGAAGRPRRTEEPQP